MKLFLAAFLVTLSHIAGPATPPKPVATVESGGDVISLYAEGSDHCPEGAKRAVYLYRPPSNAVVEGCYKVVGKYVYLGFVDGDTGIVSVERFKWSQKPATL